jgi:DNA polymerase elongation subunit (family B)
VYVDKQMTALRKGQVPLEKLLMSQRLTREVDDYSSPSPAARAAKQLLATGRTVRPGQRVRFLFTLGKPGVHAWDVPDSPDPRSIDLPRYRTLFNRAVDTVLTPIQQSITGGKESECLYLFPLKNTESWVRGAPNISASEISHQS